MAKSPYVKEGSLFQIGDTQSSILSEADFQSLRGDGWILMDGRDVTGSAYHALTGNTLIPDGRGMVLRGKNNGRVDGNQNPDGDLALGTFQNHQFGSHNHGGGSHTHIVPTTNTGSVAGDFLLTFNGVTPETIVSTNAPSATVVQTQGGNENRMRNITVNIFVKVN